MTFEELPWKVREDGMGNQAIVRFPNGYGASVIDGPMFYTQGGTYELAVLDEHGLCYTTPITSDVLGRLSKEEVTATLQQIEALPPEKE